MIVWNKGLSPEQQPWYGKKLSEEHKRKISDSLKGKQSYLHGRSYIDVFGECKAEEIRKKQSSVHMGKEPWNKGMSCSEETKQKLSESLKGRIAWNKDKCLSLEHRYKLSENHKGMLDKHHSEETRRKISEAQKGEKGYWFGIFSEKHPNWQGGKSFEPYSIEFNEELKNQIRAKDGYKCAECGFSEEQLEYALSIHHIDYDKENNNPNNLISLCKSCHAQTNFDRNDWTEYFQNKIGGV